MRTLERKRALVIGGSGGIGRAVTTVLASLGANLTIHGGHDSERLKSAAVTARSKGVDVSTVLRCFDRVEDAEPVIEAAGRVDILVVSFGPYLEAPVSRMTEQSWHQVIALNLTLPGVLISRVLPAMIGQSWGRILVFGGPRSDRMTGYRQIAGYAAAKAGLASLVRSVALQHGRDGIRCNMICPGYVDTEYYSEELRGRIRNRSPAGRMVSVDEIAALARTLFLPESDPINGALIPVDFGF